MEEPTQVSHTTRRLTEALADVTAILNGLPAMIAYWDRDLHNRMANRAYVDYFGWTPESMKGVHISEVLGPELFKLNAPFMERALAGQSQLFDREIPTPRGPRYTQASYIPDLVDGEVRGFFVLVTDITERRQAELALSAAEARFRTLFEAAPTCTLLLDRQARIVAVNAAGEELLGRDRDQLIGSSMLDLVHPEERDDTAARLEQLWRREVKTIRVEKRYLHALGHTIWTQVEKTLIGAEGGAELYVLEQAQDISSRRRHEEDLAHLASHDALTGLLNRRGLIGELERQATTARRYGSSGTLLVIDLDHFKFVNDSLGHKAGDEMIARVADLVQERVRESDIVARLGGDEFAVILPRGGMKEAQAVAHSIITMLRTEPSMDPAGGLPVTASIGIAQFTDSLTAEEVLQAADLAMYDAKEAGRDQTARYVQGALGRPGTEARIKWITRVREALADGGLRLVSQPIVDVRTGEPALYELLIRLLSEDGDLVPPASFLDIAERFDLVQEIDCWVITQAAQLLGHARTAGRPLALAANLSGKTIADPAILEHIAAELSHHGADPHDLVLEITETAAVAHVHHARRFAQRARDLGCRLAIDDFGAGFGSFYYLKNLPVNYLKVGGEFVAGVTRNTADALIVQAVRDLARGMQHEVIAEHCADADTQHWLTSHDIYLQQGYHLGPPRPIEQALAYAID